MQKKVEEIEQQVHLDQNVEGAYLTHLLVSEQMTITEILGSITELLMAGVDTVSVCRRRGDRVCLNDASECLDRLKYSLHQTHL